MGEVREPVRIRLTACGDHLRSRLLVGEQLGDRGQVDKALAECEAGAELALRRHYRTNGTPTNRLARLWGTSFLYAELPGGVERTRLRDLDLPPPVASQVCGPAQTSRTGPG